MLRLAKDLAIPLGLIALIAIWPIANFKAGGTLWMLHGGALLVLRLALVVGAGFLATYKMPRSLWAAAAAGAAMFFVEQIVVNGVFFIVDGQPGSALAVVQSFVLLVWVPCLVGLLGGLIGRFVRTRRSSAAA